MNFLAHAFLAGDSPADQLGGLIGDFVKGPLPAGLPAEVAAGVKLHRLIDVFAETEAAFARSRARVSPPRRRVAGVIVDMVYDHFLALHWSRFRAEPLDAFTSRMYRLMDVNAALLPPRLLEILPRMRDADWLASYRSAESTALALDRIGLRLRRENLLRGSGAELVGDYAGFETDFFAFIGPAQRFAENWLRER
ncbi:acyl carrier protein phosphodiesterase [Aromatoleum sp.]|uniref:acyl carrier protein phosphodiesterase n=1 Tax=Aromatoleum sp. TaxID=2307007 RepID=UPI002FCA80A0